MGTSLMINVVPTERSFIFQTWKHEPGYIPICPRVETMGKKKGVTKGEIPFISMLSNPQETSYK